MSATPAQPGPDPAARRPPQVLGAVVLGSIGSVFCLLLAISAVAVSQVAGALWLLLAALFLGIGGTLVTGGVSALRGRRSSLLQAGAAALAAVAVVTTVIGLVGGFGVSGFYLLLTAIGVAVVLLLRLPDVRAWFHARSPD